MLQNKNNGSTMKNYKTFLSEAKKVNPNQAASKLQKLVDMLDSIEDMISDMQDQDMISTKEVKEFGKGASDMRKNVGNIKKTIR